MGSPETAHHNGVVELKEQGGLVKTMTTEVAAACDETPSSSQQNQKESLVPLRMKLLSILLVTAVGFGSHWSSGVTGAMKSTLKKVNRYDHQRICPGEILIMVETTHQQLRIRSS